MPLCQACNAVTVYAGKAQIIVHEIGCVDAYKTEIRECKECTATFTPEYANQVFCSDHCYRDHYDLDCYCDFCIDTRWNDGNQNL